MKIRNVLIVGLHYGFVTGCSFLGLMWVAFVIAKGRGLDASWGEFLSLQKIVGIWAGGFVFGLVIGLVYKTFKTYRINRWVGIVLGGVISSLLVVIFLVVSGREEVRNIMDFLKIFGAAFCFVGILAMLLVGERLKSPPSQ